jgi:arsenical pump membrane protein
MTRQVSTGLSSITLRTGLAQSAYLTASAAGLALAFGSNLMNNLPAGLIAGSAVQAAHLPPQVAGAVLIGVDLPSPRAR